MNFKEYYQKELAEKALPELGISNIMEIPRVMKVVVNVGAGEAVSSKGVLEKIQEQIALITGQKPIITKARKSISAFKIRKGLPIGVKVTLRGNKMLNFVEKLIKIVIPRIRDFRGISENNIDAHGNINIGFSEQTIFPEIDFDKIDKIRGLEVTLVTNAKDKSRGKKFFELLGIAFKK